MDCGVAQVEQGEASPANQKDRSPGPDKRFQQPPRNQSKRGHSRGDDAQRPEAVWVGPEQAGVSTATPTSALSAVRASRAEEALQDDQVIDDNADGEQTSRRSSLGSRTPCRHSTAYVLTCWWRTYLKALEPVMALQSRAPQVPVMHIAQQGASRRNTTTWSSHDRI